MTYCGFQSVIRRMLLSLQAYAAAVLLLQSCALAINVQVYVATLLSSVAVWARWCTIGVGLGLTSLQALCRAVRHLNTISGIGVMSHCKALAD